MRGVQYVAAGVHESCTRRPATTLVHAAARHRRRDAAIRRAWTFTDGRFFSEREQSRAAQVVVLGGVAAEKLFGGANPVGREILLWNQPFKVVGVVASATWIVPPAAGDDQFDAVYMPFTTMHRLLNLSKLNDITVTAASTGDVTRVSKDVTELLRARHGIGDEGAGRLHGRHAGAAVARRAAACVRRWRAPWPATSAASRRSRSSSSDARSSARAGR